MYSALKSEDRVWAEGSDIDADRRVTLNARDDVIMRWADFRFRCRVWTGGRRQTELAGSGSLDR